MEGHTDSETVVHLRYRAPETKPSHATVAEITAASEDHELADPHAPLKPPKLSYTPMPLLESKSAVLSDSKVHQEMSPENEASLSPSQSSE